MNATILRPQGSLLTHSMDFLNEYERVISASLMFLLVASLFVLVVIKFENYRLYQSVSSAESQHQSLLLQRQEILVEQSKGLGYLSRQDYANKVWQVAQT